MYELFPAVCAVLATDPRPRGMCLSLCGPYGVECPSGYECRSNGCGHECFRPANYVVPEGKGIQQVFVEAFNRSELFWSPVVFFSRTTEPNSTKRTTNYVVSDKTSFKKSSPDPPRNLVLGILRFREFKFVQTIGWDFIRQEIIGKCKKNPSESDMLCAE